jgi:peptidyl-prolyl cis-trans isomerase D
MLGLMLLLIIPSFVFFGIEGYRASPTAANAMWPRSTAAESRGRVGRSAHQRRSSACAARCPDVDVRMFDTPEPASETLDRPGARARAAGSGRERCT